MESVELCARLSRLVRADGGASAAAQHQAGELRAALDATVAFYDDGATPATPPSPASGVDDMVLMALQRLLLTTVRDGSCDSVTQERAFAAVALLLRRCQHRLSSARVVDLLQACVLYLPTPSAALDGTSDTTPTKAPEELTLGVLGALQLVLSAPAAETSVHQLTRSQDSTHFLAYVVSSLLQLAERERHRGLAALAINVLNKLLHLVAVHTHVLRMFFPGVSVGMWKTMSAPLQSSKVVVAALECLSSTLSACLGVGPTSKRDVSPYSLERLRQLHDAGPAATTTPTEASDVWLVQAAEKVDVLLSHILSSKAMDRQPWRVRCALVGLCSAVVIDCRASLAASFFRCFEELMVLRMHAIADVAQASEDAIDRLKNTLSPEEWLSLEPLFAERFQMQVSTLALQCGTEHESVSAHTMEVLIGYLRFQKQRFQGVLDENLHSTMKALCHVLAFNGFDVDLLRHESLRAESADKAHEKALVLPYFQKRFRHFHDEASIAVAMRLLRNVGAVATPAVVVDTSISLLQAEESDESTSRGAVLVILNECLRANISDDKAKSASAQDNVHLVGRVLDDLLALPLWSSTSLTDKNTTALLIECIGVCVELCGRAFEDFLLYALYPLVEKLGDPASQVEQAALTTLQRIASECGYGGDLHALFSANMDYFVDALCARLEQLELYPQSPQVVEALLRYTTVASLPLVDEITRSLLRAVDVYQDAPRVTTALLRSLKLLLDSFAFESTELVDAAGATQGIGGGDTPSLTRFLLEIRALTEPFSDELEDDGSVALTNEGDVHTAPSSKSAMPVEFGDGIDGDESENRGDGDEDDKEPPPLSFQAQTVEILERCSYFVSDADPVACCLVLATIEQGVQYLRPRRKELLPLIHRIWPSILHRLTVTNRPILTATMDLLATLAECAGDFIGDRFVETVWPSIKPLLASVEDPSQVSSLTSGTRASSLTRSMLLLSVSDKSDLIQPADSEASANTDAATPVAVVRSGGRVTLETKLLNATLRCLRVVCESADTVTSLVPEIADSCARFLSQSFADSTVALTQDLMLALAKLNGDEVFVAMATLSQWQPPAPPSTRFPVYDAGSVATLPTAAPKQTVSRGSRRDSPLHLCRANATHVLERLTQCA